MTNEAIIMSESIKLMKEGVLKGPGITAEVVNDKGETTTIELPEEIHTYNGWKARGFVVNKGEHSTIKFCIWKRTSKIAKEDMPEIKVAAGEEISSSMFLKKAAFFTRAQVSEVVG